MTKSYLAYTNSSIVGITSSYPCNSILLNDNTLVTGALTEIIIWNIKKNTKIETLSSKDIKSSITFLLNNTNKNLITVGYEDGAIRVWDVVSKTVVMTLNGHTGPITWLDYNNEGTVLVSGVWDIIAEQGICKLSGHKGEITCCRFYNNVLISSSKDTFIKIWDLNLQCIIQTLTGHPSEIWNFAISKNRLITGSDKYLRVWSLIDEPEKVKDFEYATYLGTVERSVEGRVINVEIKDSLLYCLSEKRLEVWAMRSDEERKKKQKRRMKRIREKDDPTEVDNFEEYSTSDEFFACIPVRVSKMSRLHVSSNLVLLNSTSNLVCIYSINHDDETKLKPAFELNYGHRSGIRAISVASDDSAIATVSNEQIKVWNISAQQCVRSIDCEEVGLCCLFVPGDRHILVGTKEGNIELIDIALGECIYRENGHNGAVWCIDMSPDMKGFMTGGGGKEVKFWEFEIENKSLQFFHSRTLQLTEDAVAVRYSPDLKFVAISLLDSTIKIFFNDTLKFFLSLYGHKLPALALDISSDSTILVSGSADKNIKIWGLDFGDCHRSIFAHNDSIMQVRFVPNTHHLFSIGKDKMLKYWDTDTFQNIMALPGHSGEVWALAFASNGDVFTAGADKSIRFWLETDEQVFLDEQKDKALEELFEQGLDKRNGKPSVIPSSGLPTEDSLPAASKATKASVESIKAGERLMDFIDLAWSEKEKWDEYEENLRMYTQEVSSKKVVFNIEINEAVKKPSPPVLNPLLLGKSWDMFMFSMFKTIKSTELEEALLVLSFNYVGKLLLFLSIFIEKVSLFTILHFYLQGFDVELVARSLLFLLRVHQKQIVATQSLTNLLQNSRKFLFNRLTRSKDEIGYNIAGLKFIEQDLIAESTSFQNAEPIAFST